MFRVLGFGAGFRVSGFSALGILGSRLCGALSCAFAGRGIMRYQNTGLGTA